MIRPTSQGYFLNISEMSDHVVYSEGATLTKSEDNSFIPVAVESKWHRNSVLRLAI